MTDTAMGAGLVSIADIELAADRIAATCLRTPLLSAAGAVPPLWIKPESLQPTGAFKLRGATKAVQSLDAERRSHGVVTHSSGNHGQALACAAARAGIPCTVVMPKDAVPVKVTATRRWGARVVLVPISERASACAAIAADTGAVEVPPFDSAEVVAGQGTVGLEIVTDMPDVMTVVVPVGGGGLISGVAAAVKARAPRARVIGAEPELAGDLAEGFAAGRRVSWSTEDTAQTMADGLRASAVGDLNWRHIEAFVDDVITVSEDGIADAMRYLATSCRLVAEPSGAVATAACLAAAAPGWGPTVAIVSGGNVDPAQLAAVLAASTG